MGSPVADAASFDFDALDDDDDGDFFTEVDYLGAFAPTGPVWLTGWSVLATNGYLSGLATPTVDGPEAASFGLSVGPNPAGASTTVRFTLDRAQDVRVALYDVLGREVAVVADGAFGAGTTVAQVNTGALSSGVYVLRLQGEGAAATRQVSVVR